MPSVKVRRRTSYVIEHEDREFEVKYEPCDWTDVIVKELPNGRVVVGYLSHDEDCSDPLEDCDGSGKILRWGRYGHDGESEARAELGLNEYGERDPDYDAEPNPYAVLLDCHEHGQVCWDTAGHDEFDRADGLWIPDEACLEHIESFDIKSLLPKELKVEAKPEVAYTLPDGTRRVGFKSVLTAYLAAGRELGIKVDKAAVAKRRRAEAEKCAEQACETFTSWCNGDAHGVCVEVFDADGERIGDVDACWGHVGHEYAEQALADEVEATVKQEMKTS